MFAITSFIRALLIPLLFAFLGLAATWLQPPILAPLGLHFESVLSCACILAILLSAGFGRARVILPNMGLLLLVWLLPLLPFIQADQSYIALAGAITALLVLREKGLRITSLLQRVVLFGAIAAFIYTALKYGNPLANPVLSQVYEGLNQLSSTLAASYTALEAVIVGVLLFSSTLIVFIRTTAIHVSTLACVWVFALSPAFMYWVDHYHYTPYYWLIVPVVACFAVVKDAFHMAYRDELTGIPSRRALMQLVQGLGRKYTLVMCDVDHFKKFNDTWGHDTGDEVLKLVASRLSRVSGGGKAYRYGGEEFTLVFAGKTPDQVLPFVEQVREELANYPLVIRKKPRPSKAPKKQTNPKTELKRVHISCSFGMAQRTADIKTFPAILKQADIALYDAKKAGRNCVKISRFA